MDVRDFEELASQAAVLRESSSMMEDLHQALLGVVNALAETIDAKDEYTHGHSARVAAYSVTLANLMGLPIAQITSLRLSAALHDVGKIGVPESILNKVTPLTPDEFLVIRQHTTIGYSIISKVPALEDVVRGILEHHERMDGLGYPHGIYGEQISLFGRIIGVTDAFDAMTTDRVYRPALSQAEALNRIRNGAGTQFDPEIVGVLELACELGEIHVAYAEGMEIDVACAALVVNVHQ